MKSLVEKTGAVPESNIGLTVYISEPKYSNLVAASNCDGMYDNKSSDRNFTRNKNLKNSFSFLRAT